MEEKHLCTIDQILKKYQLESLNSKCNCNQTMDLLCVDNCGEPSLHCQNTKCNHSYQKHKFCRKISLQGLTALLERRFDGYRPFLKALQMRQEQLIKRMRRDRQQMFSQILFRGFQNEQIVALEQIFIRKNISSVKGMHIDDLYKKLLIQKRSNQQNQQETKSFQSQLIKVQFQMKELRKKIQNHNQSRKTKEIQDEYGDEVDQEDYQEDQVHQEDEYGDEDDYEDEYEDQGWKQSKILNSNQDVNLVLNYLNNPKQVKLLFRASQYKFLTSKFHQICDGIPNLLVLVKTEFGKIIGGFNPMGWKNDSGWCTGNYKRSFIFSVSLKQKMNLVQKQYAIGLWGPVFGNDLQLSNKCNQSTDRQCFFPHAYNFASKPYTRNQYARKLFCGSQTGIFKVSEYEVFSVSL